jgi:HK97 family phage prohead protease
MPTNVCPAQMERRLVAQPSAKVGVVKREDGTSVLVGYGSVFYRSGETGTEYQLWDSVFERVDRHAFDRALSEKHDARGLFNHNPDNLLGRVANGTMRLSVDETGLKYEIDLNSADPDHQRVLAKVTRGDLSGSSFSFRPTKVEWVDDGTRELRVIKDLELYDTGPVTYPAYEGTSVAARHDSDLVEARNEHKEWQAEKERLAAEKEAATRSAETPTAESGSVVEELAAPPIESVPTIEQKSMVEDLAVETPTGTTPMGTDGIDGRDVESPEAIQLREELAFKKRKLIASLW